MELLGGIHRAGTTVLLVTHVIKVATRTKRVVFMIDGRIAAGKELGGFVKGKDELKRRESSQSAWLQEQGFQSGGRGGFQ